MFYDVFVSLCIEKGISPTKAVLSIGRSKSAVTDWKNGTMPNSTTVRKLADFFGVDPSVFTGEKSANVVRIPVLGSVPAGVPIEAIEDIADWEEIPKAMTAGGKEFFALRVQGVSMWPKFMDGDTVIVRKSMSCHSGDYCVVYVDGNDATLKKVIIDDATRSICLSPENPNYFPRTYTAKEVEELPVSIAGVVVELRRKI